MLTEIGVMTVAIAIIALALYFGAWFIIRFFARIPWYWTFNPANTFALVVTEQDQSANGMEGGGNIVNILHAVPGHTLIRDGEDLMNWRLEEIGEDPDHDNFFFRKLGVQRMGGIFYALRLNVDKRSRYARDKDKPTESLHTVTKINETHHVFFTGEMTVTIKEADTADKVFLNFEIDFVFERKYPARSVLRVADAPALLTSFVENIVNNETVGRPVAYYYGGEETKGNREALVKLIHGDETDLHKLVEKELGLDITSVSVRSVEIDPEYREVYAREAKAIKEAAALTVTVKNTNENTVNTAEAQRQAKLKSNDAEADYVARVILPRAANENTVAVSFADALEKNKTLTSLTYAPGSDKVLPLQK